MADYVLSCCSTADLSREHFEARNLSYLCFHYSLNGADYLDDLGRSVPFPDFYQAMADGASTNTSQINIAEYVEYFTRFMEAGQDVFHVCLSSGISGSYLSAVSASRVVKERYPQRKLVVVDSLAASSGFGLLMDAMADQRDKGLSIEELEQWFQANRLHLHHWFFSTDLTYYVRGGRISKASGIFGGLLNICPLLNVDYLGRLIPRAKVRTKARVIREIVNRMEKHAQGGTAYNGKCYISHSACYEDARAVADLVEARFPDLNGKAEINDIGATIGSHTGPGTVALFFWGDERRN